MESVYVFDMGGVLKYSFDYSLFYKLLNCTCSYANFLNMYTSELLEIETGKITDDIFFNNIIKSLNLSISLNEIKNIYLKCTNTLCKDTVYIIDRLKKENKKVYLLSDLKPIDYENLKRIYNINNFNKLYLSFNIGYKKTDINAFKYLINDLKIEPKNILFFDDNKLNIDNALKIGIKAYQVTGDTILDTFNKYNLF